MLSILGEKLGWRKKKNSAYFLMVFCREIAELPLKISDEKERTNIATLGEIGWPSG